ncbi:MAG: hypothetical protein ACM359_09470 [Bacillota bacterium]
MTFAKFVEGDKVVIPAYLIVEPPRIGELIVWENHKYRVVGRPLRNDRTEVGCRWHWQPVIPVTEVPMDTTWLPPVR